MMELVSVCARLDYETSFFPLSVGEIFQAGPSRDL